MFSILVRCVICALALSVCGSTSAQAQSCAGDVNGDAAVDGIDLAGVLASWGPCPTGAGCPADLNGDAEVNAMDLSAVLAGWGPCQTAARFVGRVVLSDGFGVSGAVVLTEFGGSASTDAYGQYQLDVELPPGAHSVTVSAVATVTGVNHTGRKTVDGVAGSGVVPVDPILAYPTNDECAGDFGWISTFGLSPGMTEGTINAMAVFDDGGGPQLYVGGSFYSAPGVPATEGLAKWDGARWSGVGFGTVRALKVWDEGSGPSLYVGGDVGVWRWRGSGWKPLGLGVSGDVHALEVFDDGTGSALYVGGAFTTAGGAPASRIAKWNGLSWSALGSGFGPGIVRALQVFDDGTGAELYAGGSFTVAGGVPASRIASWDGKQWSPLGGGLGGINGPQVKALGVFDDGSGPALFVGGSFTTAGGTAANRVAKWDGATWSMLGSGLNGEVRAFAMFNDGSGPALYVGGAFTEAGGMSTARFAKWDGAAWAPLGGGLDGAVNALVPVDLWGQASLFVGGEFNAAGDVGALDIVRWTSSGWSALGRGMGGSVDATCVFDDGSGPALYIAGRFATAGGLVTSNIVKWDGANWSTLGSGLVGSVSALAVFDDGSGPALFAGGGFYGADGAQIGCIAKWDNGAWQVLGGGGGNAQCLTVFDDGTGPALYVAGVFQAVGGVAANNIAKWDGVTWSPLGVGLGGGSSIALSLAVFDHGTGPALYVGGSFTTAGGIATRSIARWDGKAWSALGGGISLTVWELEVFDDGSGAALYVGGQFVSAGGVLTNSLAKWDGSQWSAVGGGVSHMDIVQAMVSFDDGIGPSLYVAGTFTGAGGIPAIDLARWDGTTWASVGTNLPTWYRNNEVKSLSVFDDGTGAALFVGGALIATPSGDSYLAKWGCVTP
jgi:hypothetical protein